MLVIHPKDKTTEFLCEIYKNIDCEVISNGNYSSSLLRRKIKEHDKIVFLGHGTENGLLRTPIDGSLLISSKFVQFLRGKECVYIWCNADQFVKKYGLSGFATRMIISEPDEALMLSVPFTMETILQSNLLFAKAIAPNILKNKQTILTEFYQNYRVENNSVVLFNKCNAFVF